MNYYRFLDSRDIRNHLENMEYPLSTPEAAYLVWQCHNATLEEKFTAWEEIAKIMPDCPIPRRPGMADDVPSVHQFLRDYMDLEKNRLEDFTQGENCVFGADFSLLSNQEWRKEPIWSDCGRLFSDYTNGLAYCRQELSEEIGRVRIWNQALGGGDVHRNSLTLTAKLEPLRLDMSPTCDLDDVFPSLWVDLPTPFRRGDIVWDPSREPGFPHCDKSVPFVLDFCGNWNTSQIMENGVRPEVAQRGDKLVEKHCLHGDTSDMGAQGFAFHREKGFWSEFGGFANYLNLEYYPSPLEGNDQVLAPLSQFLKGELGVRSLVERVENILHQEPYKSIRGFCRQEYTKEAQELAGFVEKEEEQE